MDVADAWNINAKYVTPLGVNGQWLNVEASYIDSDIEEAKTLDIAADYYLDNHLGIGGGLTHYAYDDEDFDTNENEYFIRVNQYFTDRFAANLSYVDGDYESRWTIGASLRF